MKRLPVREHLIKECWFRLGDPKRKAKVLTVSELINAVQVSRNTFYYHFSDVAELTETAFCEWIRCTASAAPMDSFSIYLSEILTSVNRYKNQCATLWSLSPFSFAELLQWAARFASDWYTTHGQEINEDWLERDLYYYVLSGAIWSVLTQRNERKA
ncbi:MAG: TetR/AcrR family transcriptional regulator [Oscillospiraceae bacterium]|nr:TetR/AcrR family transcriptional regulator [Oscillospiraceae bacterium]